MWHYIIHLIHRFHCQTLAPSHYIAATNKEKITVGNEISSESNFLKIFDVDSGVDDDVTITGGVDWTPRVDDVVDGTKYSKSHS